MIHIVSLICNLLCVLIRKTGRQTAGRMVQVDRLTNQLTSRQWLTFYWTVCLSAYLSVCVSLSEFSHQTPESLWQRMLRSPGFQEVCVFTWFSGSLCFYLVFRKSVFLMPVITRNESSITFLRVTLMSILFGRLLCTHTHTQTHVSLLTNSSNYKHTKCPQFHSFAAKASTTNTCKLGCWRGSADFKAWTTATTNMFSTLLPLL